MPRTARYPQNGQPGLIPAGTYTLDIDGFKSSNATGMLLTLQVVNWPGTPEDTLISGTIYWNTGGAGVFTFGGGNMLDKAGNPVTHVRAFLEFAKESDGQGGQQKRNANGGTMAITINQALTTLATLEAV